MEQIIQVARHYNHHPMNNRVSVPPVASSVQPPQSVHTTAYLTGVDRQKDIRFNQYTSADIQASDQRQPLDTGLDNYGLGLGLRGRIALENHPGNHNHYRGQHNEINNLDILFSVLNEFEKDGQCACSFLLLFFSFCFLS